MHWGRCLTRKRLCTRQHAAPLWHSSPLSLFHSICNSAIRPTPAPLSRRRSSTAFSRAARKHASSMKMERSCGDTNTARRMATSCPAGNILLAVKKCKPFPAGAVVEVTRKGDETVIFKGQQHEIHTASPLKNGRILIAEGGRKPRLMEVDREGKIHIEFPLQCQTKNLHMGTRMARKLDDGTYLAPHLLDFAVKQYDKTGKVLKTFDTTVEGDPNRKIHTWPFTAIRLADGSTHVNLTHSNRAVRFDADGKIIWQVTNKDLPGPVARRSMRRPSPAQRQRRDRQLRTAQRETAEAHRGDARQKGRVDALRQHRSQRPPLSDSHHQRQAGRRHANEVVVRAESLLRTIPITRALLCRSNPRRNGRRLAHRESRHDIISGSSTKSRRSKTHA